MTNDAGFLLVLEPLAVLDVTFHVRIRGSVRFDGQEVARLIDLQNR